MKTMNSPSGVGDLLEHRLEPLLELAAELGAGDERAHVERDEPLVLQALRHVAVDDALRESFDDRRLADAGLADEHRVVFGAARQHLHDAANLLVAADDGVELALARRFGEVARVALERLILILGRLVGDAMRAAHGLERLEQRVVRRARRVEQSLALGTLGVRQREQQMLGRHVLVAELLRFVFGAIEDLVQLARGGGLSVALLGIAVDLARDLLAQLRDAGAELLEDGNDDALVLLEEGGEQMEVEDDRIAVLASDADGVVERFAGFDGESIGVDHARVKGNGSALPVRQSGGDSSALNLRGRVKSRRRGAELSASAGLDGLDGCQGSDQRYDERLRQMTQIVVQDLRHLR